jgi:hypothetical protein
LTRDGAWFLCADGLNRYYYPIIAGFMTDYEEQITITGVKYGIHYIICHVEQQEREDLNGT